MKEKERYTILDFFNDQKLDRAELLKMLGLNVESEEFYQLFFAQKPGVQTSVTKVPVVMGEYIQKYLPNGETCPLKLIKRSRPMHYDKPYEQIKTRFGFTQVTLIGGKSPIKWLLVSEPELAGEHKDKVLAFQEWLRQHGFKLNEGECLQIDVCKTWKEAKK